MGAKVKDLMDKYGELFSEEVKIKLNNVPSSLFQWFITSMLFSTRINTEISVNAAKELISKGWTTAKSMNESTWSERVNALNKANYTRYQEKTATFLGDISKKMLQEYNGDLRKLREKADGDPDKLRKYLKEFKGEGDSGVDIFFREIQKVWHELFPFADAKALKVAKKMKLPTTAKGLAGRVNNNKNQYIKLLAALVRADLEEDYDLKKSEEKEAKSKHNLSNLNKTDLYAKAQKKNIPGRSKMTKKQLVKVLKSI